MLKRTHIHDSNFIVMEFGMGLDPKNSFELVNPLRRECPPGFKKRYLEPTKRCKDQFTIGSGKIYF